VDTTGQDVLYVELPNGEEVEVFNHVSVSQHFYVNSINGYDEFQADISPGDAPSPMTPDYVTQRLATLLYDEFGIEMNDYGIQPIDVDDEEITVL